MTGQPASRRARSRAWAAAMVAAAVACALAGCMTRTSVGRSASSPASTSRPAAGTLPGGKAIWLLTRFALGQLVTDPVIRAELAGSRVYEILQPGQQPLRGVTATPVVTFPAVAELAGALSSGGLPAGTRAVLYDPEAWAFTPADEQGDPAQAAARAAGPAHARGQQFIVAPALNLTTVLAPRSAVPRWQQFLDLELAAKIAKVADVVDLQAQSLERDTATYAAFVREAAAQARTANPGVRVLAGLSTNPPGDAVDSQHLAAAIRASWPTVDGWWLNIPGRGPRCPTCNAARPEVGIAALRSVL